MLPRDWEFDSIRNVFSASAMSHFEIGGGKRIYRHLSGSEGPGPQLRALR